MRDLERMLGKEHSLDDINHALARYVRNIGAPVVGALHVTCADESEWECIDSFQRTFVEDLLPSLKFTAKSPFRISNLGARYEWGALAVAEHHFATPDTRDAFKALLVKVNGHVAVTGTGSAARYGRMDRYETESTACGALHALMAGGDKPFLRDLREAFESEGADRLAPLLDPAAVDPTYRSLYIALVSARLQTRRVELEIQEHQPASPTVYVVASCVTLNRPERDTELLAGVFTADSRDGATAPAYRGLSDDPTSYQAHAQRGRLHVSDAGLTV